MNTKQRTRIPDSDPLFMEGCVQGYESIICMRLRNAFMTCGSTMNIMKHETEEYFIMSVT